MRFNQVLHNYGEALQRLIYPAHCGVCRQILELEEKHLCQACFEKLEALRLPLEDQCLDISLSFVSQTWVLYPYRSPLKEILTAVKFQKKRWLLRLFKKDLENFAQSFAAENDYDAIIPIPLARARLLEREFNQTEILGRFLAEALQRPLWKILQKKYPTPSQSRLSREARKINLLFAFQIKSRKKVAGKKILLLDDILTTGATAEETARTLREAGAKSVDLLTIAYTSEERMPLSSGKRFAQNHSLWDTNAP